MNHLTSKQTDFGRVGVTLMLFITLLMGANFISGCEGLAGPEGPQGEQGPVGPAGEDGSEMYAGQGAPAADLGDLGDYYLDLDLAELYGPKTEQDGWGNPLVLAGEKGEDGSQIHAGNGAPDASLGAEGDYYLNKDTYDFYGPKTENGWGTPINLKGADGNANVEAYNITVARDEWDSGLHYGDGNIYRRYDIQQSDVNGIDISNFFGNGGLIMVYARISFNSSGYDELKQLPYLASIRRDDNTTYGIRIEFLPAREAFTITRTTNGYDANSIAESDIPDQVSFKIVFAEASAASKAKAPNANSRDLILEELETYNVDINSYEEIKNYFNLK